MPNKIHQELKQLAKEILEIKDPYDYQKVYESTLLLFERLILIKNEEEFSKGFRKDIKTNFDQSADFIKIQPKSETAQGNFNDREEPPNIIDTVEEIVKEIPEASTPLSDLFHENSKELSFVRKEEETITNKVIKKSLNDKFSKGLQVDLNDRLAFINYLFDNNTNEYQRAISQIATLKSWKHAQKFILEIIKPDYNYWKGKEQYEIRFLKIVENNFQ